MKAIKEVCVAGRVIDVTVKLASGSHSGKRRQKRNVTPEAVRANNDRIAVKNLSRILNANFKGGDIHLVLTYKDPPSEEQAKKDRTNYIRRLRRKGLDIKAIAVAEKGKHGRIHHHIVISGASAEDLAAEWKEGWANIKYLDDTGDYTKLAEYLIKETTERMRESDAVFKKRYSCYGNLIRPVVKREEISISDLLEGEDPKPIKGYYIPKDSIRRFEHPVTGIEHLEYRMLAIDEPRKYKAWPRGKKVKPREYFRIEGETQTQEDVFDLLF